MYVKNSAGGGQEILQSIFSKTGGGGGREVLDPWVSVLYTPSIVTHTTTIKRADLWRQSAEEGISLSIH